MKMEALIQESEHLIRRMLGRYHRPCVLWSGGKDSTVLLHLVRSIRPEIDVICWREPWMPGKNDFTNWLIRKWNLTVWDWAPAMVSLCKGKGRVDVLNWYSWGAAPMMLARGTERPIEGEPFLCGRDTFLSRPLTDFKPPWGVSFHGHKSSDIDLICGQVPLEVDMMDTPNVIPTVFPLRHWEDEDIFEYTEKHSVPYDWNRYGKIEGKWEVLPYQSKNPDYFPTCVKCLDPDEPEFVDCPKLDAQINNISAHVRWDSPQLNYCNMRTRTEEEKDALRTHG